MRDWITLERIAGLKGVPYQTLKKRLQRSRVALMNDPEDARRKLAPITVLSPEERAQWLKEEAQKPDPQASPAHAPTPAPEGVTTPQDPGAGPALEKQESRARSQESGETALTRLQASLPFMPPSASQAARDAVVAAVPKKNKAYVDRWMDIIADNVNGTWKRYQGTIYGGVMVNNRDDFMHGQASLHDLSISSIYAKIKMAREIISSPEIPKPRKWKSIAESLVPRARPGRSAYTFFTKPENAWMLPELRRIYLNQAKHSVNATYSILIEVTEAKQRAWGLGHLYERPTLWQVRTALEKIPLPEGVLARQGEKAYNDRCAPYLSRDYSTLGSNALWVTDQRLVNVRLRGAGERLGRIWLVNFLDVASFKWLGFWFSPILSSEVVMMAAAMAMGRWGVPGAIHMDLGKEFIAQAFNGSVRKFSGATLYKDATGLWNRLGTQIVEAIGRNPQTKTIERWHHVIDDFDKRFPGWCGSSPDEKPEKEAVEEAQHFAWLEGKAASSPLITIEQYIRAFAEWAETKWNAQHRGRGKILQGATPNEAYNAKRPGRGVPNPDRRSARLRNFRAASLKVARGGQVNLSFYGQAIEYVAPELFNLIGQEVEVIRSRRSLRAVTVIYPVPGGTGSCTAVAKPQFHWLSDDPEERELMRQAIRCKAAMKRAIKAGVAASNKTLMAGNPVEMLVGAGLKPAATSPAPTIPRSPATNTWRPNWA